MCLCVCMYVWKCTVCMYVCICTLYIYIMCVCVNECMCVCSIYVCVYSTMASQEFVCMLLLPCPSAENTPIQPLTLNKQYPLNKRVHYWLKGRADRWSIVVFRRFVPHHLPSEPGFLQGRERRYSRSVIEQTTFIWNNFIFCYAAESMCERACLSPALFLLCFSYKTRLGLHLLSRDTVLSQT